MGSALIDRIAAALPPPVARRETHTAWVLLSGDRVLKIRKPVRLPFVDYSTLARRCSALDQEIALNEPLAPGIYRGMRSVIERPDGGVDIRAGVYAGAAEYAVEMRRFDEDATMAARAMAGTLTGRDVERVGERLASFHRDAWRRPDDRPDGAARFGARVWADLNDLGEPPDGALRRYGAAAIARRAAELDGRARRGMVREGHGDLRGEHVVLADPLLIVDRLEFDADLRTTDVASDLAFLVMDLERLGAPDAARRLVWAYERAGGDGGSPQLRALLEWQRVLVRTKVARIGCDADEMSRLGHLGIALEWRERLPAMVLVCGPPASGKSTLAAALASLTRRPVVSTDLVRKAMRGVAPTERLEPEAYSEEATNAVYDEVARRAGCALADADGVIIDATARTSSLRARLTRGLDAGPPVVLVCVAPRAELIRRADGRDPAGAHGSDAGPVVARRLADTFRAPLADEPGLGEIVTVDTTRTTPLDAAAESLDARVAPAPAAGGG